MSHMVFHRATVPSVKLDGEMKWILANTSTKYHSYQLHVLNDSKIWFILTLNVNKFLIYHADSAKNFSTIEGKT